MTGCWPLAAGAWMPRWWCYLRASQKREHLFSGKRSYLPTEIHWGYVFSEITHQSNSCRALSRRGPL